MTQATATPHKDRLSDEVLDAVTAVCDCRIVRTGEVLYAAGDPADSAYFVLSGRLQAAFPSRVGAPSVVGEVGRGHVTGVMALVAHETYALTLRAVRDSRVAQLSPESFERLGREHPDMLLSVVRFLLYVTRQLAVGMPVISAVETVALIPADGGVPVERVAEGLVAACREHGSVHLAAAGEAIEEPERLEREHDLVVYLGAPGDRDWNMHCLSRADRVILVADGTAPGGPSPALTDQMRQFQTEAPTACDLMLLRGEGEPTGTAAWLEAASFNRWYHVQPDRPADHARVARWLAGRAVGLVLSGGGARGFAHLGVVRALHEAQVPIDAVAGTSMGGIMAAGVGCDWDDAAMVAAATRTFVQSSPLRDLTIPLVSFVSGKRISRLLHETFGDRQIEDLPIPFMCVSCNLSKARADYHTRGPLWQALRATVAIPAVIAPTVRGGDLHVDGGAIDNMPVDAMRRSGVRTVIAVDVSPLDKFASNLPDTDSLGRPSLFRSLLRRHKDEAVKTPGLVSILRRSGSVSTMALQRKAGSEADHTISLQLEGVRMLDWQRLNEIADLGYEATRTQMAQWQSTPTT